MRRFSFRLGIYLAIDCLILAVCILHVPSLTHRATTPFEIDEDKGKLVVVRIADAGSSSGIRQGDVVLSWRDHIVSSPEAFEFLADLSSIGDTVHIGYVHDGEARTAAVTLVPFYSSVRFVIITLFVGLVIWGLGVYVLWKGSHDLAGRILHWLMICFATVVMLTWGAVPKTALETIVRPFLFFLSYEMGTPLFFFFTVLYPRRTAASIWLIAWLTFTPALFLFVASSYNYYFAVSRGSVEFFNAFQSVYDVFHAAILLYIGGGILRFIYAYINAETLEERRRLIWIMWGFIAGALPFVVLFLLPQLFFSRYIVDEEYTTICFLVIPFSFAVSFIRYRLFDIEAVVNRSIVYTVLTVFIVATYVLLVLLLTSLIEGQAVFEEYLLIVIVTLGVAWLVNPLRRRIQRFVDESLFTARTNFRGAIMEVSGMLHTVLSSEELFKKLAESVWRIVPAESAAVYSMKGDLLMLEASCGRPSRDRVLLKAHDCTALLTSRAIALPVALSFTDEKINLSRQGGLMDAGFSVCVPIKLESGDVGGVVALRPRSSKERYDEDEIDFLTALCTQSAEILGRLQLQERVLLEREAKRRSEELNALKSEIVSYVSHEFRTPLTSIKMFSDLLRRRLPARDSKASEYIDIIDGESERLNRMVTNLLDAARIEKGVKEYSPDEIDLGAVAKNVLESMKYQLKKYGCKLETRIPKRKLSIPADADAVAQAMMNIITNSIKYSSKEKFIRVEVQKKGTWALIRVIDRGDGISKEALPHLFEKFYREPSHGDAVEGVGLGLPLVKHIMEAHGGRVEVQSTPGKGSSFVLLFPINKKQPSV